MTVGLLQQIFEKNNIPPATVIRSDSGWECDATNTDGIFYNQESDEIVLTQGFEETYGPLGYYKCLCNKKMMKEGLL